MLQLQLESFKNEPLPDLVVVSHDEFEDLLFVRIFALDAPECEIIHHLEVSLDKVLLVAGFQVPEAEVVVEFVDDLGKFAEDLWAASHYGESAALFIASQKLDEVSGILADIG